MSFTVDGAEYNFPCSIQRKSEVKATSISGEMLNGSYFNDVIGTYLSYTVKIAVPVGSERLYADLYNRLTDPSGQAKHSFTFPYSDTTITFEGKVDSVTDTFYRQEGTANVWRGINFSVTGTRPYREPVR